jgi:hypothetical protein
MLGTKGGYLCEPSLLDCCSPSCLVSSFSQTVPQWKVIKVVKFTNRLFIKPLTLITPTRLNDYRLSAWMVGGPGLVTDQQCEIDIVWVDLLTLKPLENIVFFNVFSSTDPGSARCSELARQKASL